MYARDILLGKLVLELDDSCTASGQTTVDSAEIKLKTNVRTTTPYSFVPLCCVTHGFFSGTCNALAGRLKHGSTDELGEVSFAFPPAIATVLSLFGPHLRPAP
jgi:hypothetical protein